MRGKGRERGGGGEKKVRKSKREQGSSIKNLRGERNVEGKERKLGYLLVPSLYCKATCLL